jgi:hypothetical protein
VLQGEIQATQGSKYHTEIETSTRLLLRSGNRESRWTWTIVDSERDTSTTEEGKLSEIPVPG